jgi:hypothetical protein
MRTRSMHNVTVYFRVAIAETHYSRVLLHVEYVDNDVTLKDNVVHGNFTFDSEIVGAVVAIHLESVVDAKFSYR